MQPKAYQSWIGSLPCDSLSLTDKSWFCTGWWAEGLHDVQVCSTRHLLHRTACQPPTPTPLKCKWPQKGNRTHSQPRFYLQNTKLHSRFSPGSNCMSNLRTSIWNPKHCEGQGKRHFCWGLIWSKEMASIVQINYCSLAAVSPPLMAINRNSFPLQKELSETLQWLTLVCSL